MVAIADAVTREHVLRVVKAIRQKSWTLDKLVQEQRIAIVGAMYEVATGAIEFIVEEGLGEARVFTVSE